MTEPMGLLGLIDDETFSNLIYAQTMISGVTMTALGSNAAMIRRWLADERHRLEMDAAAQFGRPVRFEALDFDGTVFQLAPEQDAWRVLFVERPT